MGPGKGTWWGLLVMWQHTRMMHFGPTGYATCSPLSAAFNVRMAPHLMVVIKLSQPYKQLLTVNKGLYE